MSGFLSLLAAILVTLLLYAGAIYQGRRMYKRWKKQNPVLFGKPIQQQQMLDVSKTSPRQQFQLAAVLTWVVVGMILLLVVMQAMSLGVAFFLIACIIGGGYYAQYYLRRQALIISSNVKNDNPQEPAYLWVFGDLPAKIRKWQRSRANNARS
jgi:hypothetical protein